MIRDTSVLKMGIKRMAQLDGFPKFEPEAEAELCIMAAKYALSEDHLAIIIDEVMESWTKCPKPSELRALLVRNRVERIVANCPSCGGSGWKIVYKAGNTGAARCECGSVPRPPSESVPQTTSPESNQLLAELMKSTEFPQ